MNRIEEAKSWIAGLSQQEMTENLTRAKSQYSKQVRPQVTEIMHKQLPKAQKQLQVNRLLLLTMYLQEHPQTEKQ